LSLLDNLSANNFEPFHTSLKLLAHCRGQHVQREDLRIIANETVKNFNANAGVRSPQEQIDDAMRLLEAAY